MLPERLFIIFRACVYCFSRLFTSSTLVPLPRAMRRRRIAKGSGTSVQDVNNLLKQYGQARKMMKSLSGNMGFLGKKMAKMGGLGKLGLPGF